jgi:pimeloyl-ACP methyl ester carboxylesterase
MARTWQSPGEGEAAVAAMVGARPEDRAAFLAAAGVAHPAAERLAAAFDEEMGRCLLALYRSAAQPAMAELGQQLPAARARPGLVLVASDDHYVGTEEMARRSAERAGARVEVLDGLGHWWMLQDPDRAAATLRRFWASVPATG